MPGLAICIQLLELMARAGLGSSQGAGRRGAARERVRGQPASAVQNG